MPLDFQVSPVAFTDGLDTKTQRKLVVPGKWDLLVNMSLSDNGTPKRRDGFEALLDGQAGTGLATRGNELLVVNGPTMSTVSEVGTNLAKQVNGLIPFVDVGKSEVVSNGYNHDAQDVAYGDGYACYVSKELLAGALTDLVCTLVDVETGAKLIANTRLGAQTTLTIGARVVFADNAFWIVWLETGAPNTIRCRVIATSAPTTIGTAVSIVSDANISYANFDACRFNGSPLIAYRYADGATSVQVRLITRVGTVPTASGARNVITEAAVTVASIEGMAVVAYASDANAGVLVVHSAGGALAAGLVGAVIDAAYTVSTAATSIDATAPGAAGELHVTATAVSTNMQVFWDQQSSYGTAALRPLRSVIVSTTLAVTTAAYVVVNSACFRINAAEAAGPQGPFIASKAFTYGGVAFLPVAMLENYLTPSLIKTATDYTNTKNEQNAFFLLRVDPSVTTTFRVVAGALYQVLGVYDATYGGNAPLVHTPSSSPAIGSGFGVALLEQNRLELSQGINATLVGLSSVTLTPQTRPSTRAQLAETAFWAGGQLGSYDGQQVVQAGFPMFPEGINAVVTAPGGATKLTVGVHQIVAVYEWIDGAGNRCQSSPSLPVTVTVTNATDLITVSVPTTQLAQQAGYDSTIQPPLNLICYMTAAGGLTFYRVVSDFAAPNTNQTGASFVTITIGSPQLMTDARLTGNELLYNQPTQAGTTLPNIPPGPLFGIGVSQQRVWGFIGDEPLEYTFSQEPLPNTSLQWSPDSLGGILPAESGGGVKIHPLDEKTILLAARKLYVVFGTGPNASGGFNGFSPPQEIPSDVGCSEALSVVSIPAGIIFKSEKGWYLFGRDLSVRYIGAGVAQYDANTVSSAVMVENEQEVRFTSADGDGPTLVYSYLLDAWSVFYMGNILHQGNVTDAVWWPATGRYVHLQGSTAIFPGLMQDTPGVYIDGAGTATPLQAMIFARTGFLHLTALEGFQRVRKMYLTATAVTALPDTSLIVAVDFDDIYAGPNSYNFTVNLALITSFDEQAVDLRHRIEDQQKCKSIAFSFLEGGATDSTAIPLTGIQALALEVGLKRGVKRLPAGQTVGQ